MKLKCFGGHLHGTYIDVDSDRDRISAPVYRCFDFPHRPIRLDVQAYDIETYFVKRYSESRHGPYRVRTIHVAILEGRSLLPHEERDLSQAIRARPWDIPVISFLRDFEQWFARAVYQRMGLIWDCRFKQEVRE